MRAALPELPVATRARLLALGLARRDADVLMEVDAGREVGHDGLPGGGAIAYFDAVAPGRDPRVVVNWCVPANAISARPSSLTLAHRVTHELLGQLAYRRETFAQNAVSVAQMGELVDLVQSGAITGMHPLTALLAGI